MIVFGYCTSVLCPDHIISQTSHWLLTYCTDLTLQDVHIGIHTMTRWLSSIDESTKPASYWYTCTFSFIPLYNHLSLLNYAQVDFHYAQCPIDQPTNSGRSYNAIQGLSSTCVNYEYSSICKQPLTGLC